MKDKVTFVIVNYNGRKYLTRCFDSIYNQTYPREKIEIIFVDNNSKDKSIEFVKKRYPKAKIIVNKENNYAKANNLGIRKAKGDLIFLLNNDAYLGKGCLEILVKEISKDRRIGVVTGKILFENGKIQSTGHVELPNLYFGDRGFLERDKGQYDKKEQVKSICFASALVKMKCLEDVGLLDEDFVMYCEDVDFSIRARKRGWKLYYVPKAVTYHKYKGTSYILHPENPDKVEKYFVERNRLLLIAKHFPEKLPSALSTSASFYIKKEYDFIYSALDLIIKKLIESHGKKAFKILPKFFEELKKIILFERTLSSVESEINQKLIEKEKRLEEKNRIIKNLKKETEKLKRDLEKRLEEKNRLIKNLKKETEKLKRDFKKRESGLKKETEKLKAEFKKKESELSDRLDKKEKEKELMHINLTEEIKKRDKIIHDFFSSKGYRLILEPLDMIYRLIRPKKRKK